MKMLGNLRQNETLYFLPLTSCPKNVPAPLMVPITDALHCYVFALGTFLCPSAEYFRSEMSGLCFSRLQIQIRQINIRIQSDPTPTKLKSEV